ncbi:gp5 [Bacillus phage G]|uniref:Gp5 n=1 Tax=Bacillus phage G TaxID=2884420 RepID=G3MB75_9CAUD|nr:gp5 [Bacillus phage G]AEO93276.1 gp5 [Bacillus phage G]
MSRIKKINNNKSQSLDYTLNVDNNEEYGNNVDPEIDWTTDVDLQMDPSKNDYNKGYTMDPYQMRYYANRNILHEVKAGENYATIAEKYFGHKNYASKLVEMNNELSNKILKPGMMLIVGKKPAKVAAKEVRDITYTSDNLAKEIITIWSQVDGPLQDFFNAFTMNKMTNEMKQQIASTLNEWGYNVIPHLEDRTPRYAAKKELFNKIAKISKEKNMKRVFSELNNICPDSKVVSSILRDIEELSQNGVIVKKAEAQGLVDYFKQIFPDDYAVSLVDITLNKPNTSFEEFDENQEISDEALDQMEKMDSGNQDPMSKSPNDGGLNGYDFTTHMRSDGPGGVAPTSFETGPFNVYRASVKNTRLKKK